jgi:hypothetical protein
MSEEAGTVFDAEEVVEKDVNANGQVYLGRDLGGETVRVAYEVVDRDVFVCDECGGEFDLAEVAIFDRGGENERVVCTDCLTPEDRIIE